MFDHILKQIKYDKLLFWIVCFIVINHYAEYIIHNPYRVEYSHYDEPNWIWVSYHSWDNLISGRWNSPFWKEEYGNWGNSSPQLGKYFIGAPVWWYLRINPDIKLHNWGNFNSIDNPSVWPDFRLYYPARIQSAIFMCLITLLLMDLVSTVFNPYVSAATALFFIMHPYVVSNSFRALTDACALFGLTIALWGLFRKKTMAVVISVGLGLGWALATKINALVILPAIIVGMFLRNRPNKHILSAIIQILLILAIALFIIYFTNPYLWQEPIYGLKKIWGHSGKDNVLTSRLGHYINIFKGLFFQTSSTGLIKGSGLFERTIYICCFVFGLMILIKTRDSKRFSFVVISIIIWIMLLLSIPQDWERYYLIGIVPISVICGYGFVMAFKLIILPNIKKGQELESKK